MRHRLIVLEGIPGSGKTTTSRRLCDYIEGKGIAVQLYLESPLHPIDLPFYAYLTVDEFATLAARYPQHREYFERYAIAEETYTLVPYRLPATPDDIELLNYLRSREVCYSSTPTVPFDEFCLVFRKRYTDFVETAIQRRDVSILESSLLQHQIHDINRLYPQLAEDDIVCYLCELADILSPLDPILFYITQQDVAAALAHTASVRNQPRWTLPETVAYYEKRKRLELSAIARFDIQICILDNSSYNWDAMFDDIVSHLGT